jgi:hypothetical protein
MTIEVQSPGQAWSVTQQNASEPGVLRIAQTEISILADLTRNACNAVYNK